MESASVSLNSVSNPDMVLSYWRVDKVFNRRDSEYCGQVLWKRSDVVSSVEKTEDHVYAMYYFLEDDIDKLTKMQQTAVRQDFREQNRFIPKTENFQWVIEHDRRWGCDAQETKIVALRLSWQEAGKFFYLSQVGSNGVDVGLKEVKGESSGDRLKQVTQKELFTVEVISRDHHKIKGVGNAVSIATIDGYKRLTVDSENKPMTNEHDLHVEQRESKETCRDFLYTKYRYSAVQTHYGLLKGKLLKFKSNMQATNVLCLFNVENGKIVDDGINLADDMYAKASSSMMDYLLSFWDQ